MENFILATDVYKQSHWKFLPPGLTKQWSHIMSRGVSDKGVPAETLFHGLQSYIMDLAKVTITHEMINESELIINAIFGYPGLFNRLGWEIIVNECHGKIPVRIKAVAEGTLVPSQNVLVSVENTNPKVPWIVNHIESSLLRAVWYPTTVATTSFGIKRLIKKWCSKTGSVLSPYHLNDFGARGVSSETSAAIGGAAHLVNFMGTDNIEAIAHIMKYYGTDVCGFSVPATEHSATIIHGEENEAQTYKFFMDQVPTGPLSIVADSYDLANAVTNIFGKTLRDKIMDRKGWIVVRPDSGHPPVVTVQTLKQLWKAFGGTINAKGYKVLDPHVRVIYGDFISYGMIDDIFIAMEEAGFAAENVIFGMGGALLQQVHRDNFKFAMKTSAAEINGVWGAFSKHPATDHGKDSRAGKLMLVKEHGSYKTVPFCDELENIDELQTVYENGTITKTFLFSEIRDRASSFVS